MTLFDDVQVGVDAALGLAIVWLGRLLWLAQKVREATRGPDGEGGAEPR